MGLQPEATYEILREWGLVATQRAVVNNHGFIVIGFAAYLVFFTHRRCLEAAVRPMDAFGKALQIGVLALLAFLPLRLEHALNYQHIPVPAYRRLILFMAAAKCLAWVYLLSVLVRYYFLSGLAVYAHMVSIFPSSYVKREKQAPPAAPNPATMETEGAVREHTERRAVNAREIPITSAADESNDG